MRKEERKRKGDDQNGKKDIDGCGGRSPFAVPIQTDNGGQNGSGGKQKNPTIFFHDDDLDCIILTIIILQK